MFQRFSQAISPYANLPLRLGTGLAMVLHGWAIVGNVPSFAREIRDLDLPYHEPLAWAAIAVQILGGTLLIIGFHTRKAALSIAVVMGVATFVERWPDGYFATTGGFEYSLLLMLAALTLAMSGAGKASLDSLKGNP